MYSRRGKHLYTQPPPPTSTDKPKEFKTMLTATIIATSFLFAAIITIDFVSGLIKLWQNAGAKRQPPIEAKPVIEQPIEADPWTLPVPEQAIALPTEQPSVRQMLLPAARIQIATLDWAERNLPPAEIYAAEMPCAIALAKSRSPKVAPVIELATKAQLQSSGIRKLKQLAREIKLSGYGNMRVAQLAAALEGKVAAHQLVA